MLFLSTVESEYIIKLAQPVIDAAFETRRLLPALTFAMSHQSAAHAMLLAALDKIPERNPSLLYPVTMEIESRLNLIFSLTQVFIDPVLHSGADKF
jgi:hypothetical protein